MPKRIPATKKSISRWIIHLVIFLVVNAALWFICFNGKEGWVYPWPIWITAAWGLTMIAHASVVWASHEDRAHDEFHRQTLN